MKLTRIGAALGATLLTLGVAGTAFAADPVYATVSGHEAHSNEANEASYWGEGCTKTEWNGEDETYVLEHDYSRVVVKSGSGEFANTIFDNPSAGETVWADTDGDSMYTAEGDQGISHIIFCAAVQTEPTPTPTPEPTPTPTPEPTPTPTPEPTPTPTPDATPTPTPDATPTPTPEDSVGGETGTPPSVTLPPTDALDGSATPGTSAWAVLAVVLAGIVASVFVLTPSRRRN